MFRLRDTCTISLNRQGGVLVVPKDPRNSAFEKEKLLNELLLLQEDTMSNLLYQIRRAKGYRSEEEEFSGYEEDDENKGGSGWAIVAVSKNGDAILLDHSGFGFMNYMIDSVGKEVEYLGIDHPEEPGVYKLDLTCWTDYSCDGEYDCGFTTLKIEELEVAGWPGQEDDE